MCTCARPRPSIATATADGGAAVAAAASVGAGVDVAMAPRSNQTNPRDCATLLRGDTGRFLQRAPKMNDGGRSKAQRTFD